MIVKNPPIINKAKRGMTTLKKVFDIFFLPVVVITSLFCFKNVV